MVSLEVEFTEEDVRAALQTVVAFLGLEVVLEGRLATFPGSQHWHLKRGTDAGVLEVTYWPNGKRLWVSYHDNRIGEGWVRETAARLAAALEAELRGEKV